MTTTPRTRFYSELQNIRTFEQRYDYLRLGGSIGDATFGYDRILNQRFYKSRRWLETRDAVIIRDNGCDLGMSDYQIGRRIIVHHINPITINDILSGCNEVFDLEFLICVSVDTHLAIHYGDSSLLPRLPVQRFPNDTCLWLR